MSYVLAEVQVRELVSGRGRKLVYVDGDERLETALQLLREHGILAMPVRSLEPARTPDDPGAVVPHEISFIGMLSVLDVAAFVAREPKACGAAGAGLRVADVMRKTAESWHMLLMDPHATVDRAMEYLGSRGFHRLIVPNICLSEHAPDNVPIPSALVSQLTPSAPGEEYRVLSQSDIISFLIKEEARFGLALAQSVESVGLEGGRVLAATHNTTMRDALDRMCAHAVSALAVVEQLEQGSDWAGEGALLDTLSASDLRSCDMAHFRAFSSTTVGEFLSKIGGGQARKPIYCTSQAEVRTVLRQLVENKVHRVWVAKETADNEREYLQVTGVVTLSDIIRVMRVLPVTSADVDFEGGANASFDSLLWMEWAV